MALFGIQDPRMRFGARPTAQRETIGPPPQTLRQMDTPPQGLMSGYQSPSQGLFAAYMQQIFNQKYAPPVMPGGVQQFQGYRGFGSPMLPGLAPKPAPPTYTNNNPQDPNSPVFAPDWRTYNQP